MVRTNLKIAGQTGFNYDVERGFQRIFSVDFSIHLGLPYTQILRFWGKLSAKIGKQTSGLFRGLSQLFTHKIKIRTRLLSAVVLARSSFVAQSLLPSLAARRRLKFAFAQSSPSS